MRRAHRRFAPALLLAAAATVTAHPRDARAGWPMQRHDPARTGATDGTANLQRPAVTWRRYLGGSVPSGGLLAVDVDGGSDSEVVFISGGKLVAKKADDRLVWETQPLALDRISALEDLNGDGTLDVVTAGPGVVAIFSARTGALEWRTDLTTFGVVIASVRLGRFGQSATPSLYIADTGCGDSGSGRHVSAAYDFAGGFGGGVDNGAQRLWTLEPGNRDYWCGSNDVVADLDGDGRDEVLALGQSSLFLYDGATGRLIPSGVGTGGFPLGLQLPWGLAETDVVDVDGDGHLDVVGYSNNSTDPSISSRATFVVSYDPARADPATRLYVRWSRNVADQANDLHSYVANGAADFDGDGRYEIADSFREGGVQTAYVFDAASGAVLASIPDAAMVGVYDLGGPSQPARPTLVVRRGGMLEGYHFARLDGGLPAPDFSLPFAPPARTVDRARWRRGSAATVPLTSPVPNAARRALVLIDGQNLRAVDVGVTPPADVGTLALPDGVSVVAAAPEQNVAAPVEGLLLARSDGYLLVLDAMFATINFGGNGDVPLPGIRTGGYYSGARVFGNVPVAGRMGTAADEVVVSDSLGKIHRMDARAASLVRAPDERWTPFGAAYPALSDDDGDGTVDTVVFQRGGRLEARGTDGTTVRWSAQPAAGETTSLDPVPLRRAGGGLRWATEIVNTGDSSQRAGAVENGAFAWESSPPAPQLGGCSGGLGADDVDADGNDDVLVNLQGALRVHSGLDGASLAPTAPNCTMLPMTVRGRAGTVTHVIDGTYAPLAGFSLSPGTAPAMVW